MDRANWRSTTPVIEATGGVVLKPASDPCCTPLQCDQTRGDRGDLMGLSRAGRTVLPVYGGRLEGASSASVLVPTVGLHLHRKHQSWYSARPKILTNFVADGYLCNPLRRSPSLGLRTVATRCMGARHARPRVGVREATRSKLRKYRYSAQINVQHVAMSMCS
jgi:hypothetical protein